MGASSPFYSESGTPDYCQVTVGQSLEEMLPTPTSVSGSCSKTWNPMEDRGQAREGRDEKEMEQ